MINLSEYEEQYPRESGEPYNSYNEKIKRLAIDEELKIAYHHVTGGNEQFEEAILKIIDILETMNS